MKAMKKLQTKERELKEKLPSFHAQLVEYGKHCMGMLSRSEEMAGLKNKLEGTIGMKNGNDESMFERIVETTKTVAEIRKVVSNK
jgi:hypothetical protein